MNFVADESVDAAIVYRLRQDGHTLYYIAEMERGIDDDQVLELTNQQNTILLTADKDFGELVFRLRRVSSGIILFRLSGLSANQKAIITSIAIQGHLDELMGAFIVISPNAIRIRQMTE